MSFQIGFVISNLKLSLLGGIKHEEIGFDNSISVCIFSIRD